MQAYGKENISAARAADILTATVREGNLEASELAPVLGRVIGLASQLDTGFEEVGASIATFTRLGVDSAEAVTGLRGIMNALIKPTKQGEEALLRYGISMKDLRQEVADKGLAVTMIKLVNTFKGNEEALGAIIPNVRALSTVLGTAGAQSQEYERIVKSLTNSQGILDKAFEDTSKTAGFKLRQALTDLKVVGTQFGDVILPVIADLAKRISSLFDGLKKLNPATKTMVVRVAAVAAVVGPTVLVIGKMISVVYAASKAIRVFSLALTASPIGLVVAGIAALALAFGAFKASGSVFVETSKAVATGLEKQKVEVNALVESINEQGVAEEKRLSLLNELEKKYPAFLKGLEKEKVTTRELKDRLTEFNAQFEKKIALQAAEKRLQDNISRQADKGAELKALEEQLSTKEGEDNFLRQFFTSEEAFLNAPQKQLDAYLEDAIPDIKRSLDRLKKEYKGIRDSFNISELLSDSGGGDGGGKNTDAFQVVKDSLDAITDVPIAETVVPQLTTMSESIKGVVIWTKEAQNTWANWNYTVHKTMTVMQEVVSGTFEAIGNIIGNTFDSILSGTKVTIGGIVKEIGKMVIKLLLAAAAAAALRAILGDGSSASKGAKAATGIARLIQGFSSGLGFGGSRASGGPVTAGLQYIAGEHSRGEIFVPNQNGRIYPMMENKSGGITQNIIVEVVGRLSGQDVFLSGQRYESNLGRR